MAAGIRIVGGWHPIDQIAFGICLLGPFHVGALFGVGEVVRAITDPVIVGGVF